MRWAAKSAAVLLLGIWCSSSATGAGVPVDTVLSAAVLSEVEVSSARTSRFNPRDILDRRHTRFTEAVVLSPKTAGIQGRLRLEAGGGFQGGNNDTSAEVQELFTTFDVTEGVHAIVGKSFLTWDVSYASRPVNFFACGTDYVDLEDYRRRISGVPMAALSWTGKAGSLVGVVASDDAEETGRKQCALRAQGHFGSVEVAAMVRHQSGGPTGFGCTATCVKGRSLELHGSLFVSRGTDRKMHRVAAGEPCRFFGPGEPAVTQMGAGNGKWVPHLVLGGQYTTNSLFNVLVEYIHDGAGLSGEQWDRLLKAADFYTRGGDLGVPRSAVAANLGNIAATLRPQGSRRDYLFVRTSKWWGETEVSAGALIGLADGGVSLSGSLNYRPAADWDAWIEFRRSMGPGHSEFGEIPDRGRITLMLRFLF